ncbi:hypothetical protein VULLAG_LOCUS7353 [Vulpes lagopus]
MDTMKYNIFPEKEDYPFASKMQTVPHTCDGPKVHTSFQISLNVRLERSSHMSRTENEPAIAEYITPCSVDAERGNVGEPYVGYIFCWIACPVLLFKRNEGQPRQLSNLALPSAQGLILETRDRVSCC